MHSGRCCCKMDACWTFTIQSSCRSFVTQSWMSVGVVLLYPPYIVSIGMVSHYQPCLLVWCLAKDNTVWRGASLSAVQAGAVSHYRPCLLVWCLIIGHAFWCGASLSAMPAGVLPHYRPCLLVRCLIISHAFWCGAHYRPCLLVWCLIISHAFWCGASLYAMPVGMVPHYRTCLNFHWNQHFTSRVQMEEGWSLVISVQRCHYIRHVCWHGATLRYVCLNSATLSDMRAGFIYSYTWVCKVLLYQVRHLVCYKPIRHAYR